MASSWCPRVQQTCAGLFQHLHVMHASVSCVVHVAAGNAAAAACVGACGVCCALCVFTLEIQLSSQ